MVDIALSGSLRMAAVCVTESGGSHGARWPGSVPKVYIKKVSVVPMIPDDVIDLDAEPWKNITVVAEALGRSATGTVRWIRANHRPTEALQNS
jgi:fructose-1,6-bisphosphatase/sedoheptulose 1,7-bisphosphatase-like protein